MRTALVIAALMLAATPAHAQMINGAGAVSCSIIVADKGNQRQVYNATTWLQGYVTAANVIFSKQTNQNWDLLGDMTPEAAYAYTLNWCDKNQLELYVSAATALLNSLQEKRAKEMPKP